jgi:hypothetical protein
MEAHFDRFVANLRRGSPLRSREEFERLRESCRATARRFFELMELALGEIRTSTSTLEAVSVTFESINSSMEMLVSNAACAISAGDVGEATTALEEFDRLLPEVEKLKLQINECDLILAELGPGMQATFDAFGETITLGRWNAPTSMQTAILKLATPPALATFLLAAVCKPSLRDGTVGCAEEDFHKHLYERGRLWAVGLYWADTLRSVGPLLLRLIVRLIGAYLIVSK